MRKRCPLVGRGPASRYTFVLFGNPFSSLHRTKSDLPHMPSNRPIRILLALGVGVLFLLLLFFLLLITRSVFEVWNHLKAAPMVLVYLYLGTLFTLALGAGWVVWRLLVPRAPAKSKRKEPEPLDHETLVQRLEAAEAQGVDVGSARRELEHWQQRRAAGTVHLCLFGEISTGKSSLIRALLPGTESEVRVTGGTTRELVRHRWESPAGDALVLTDMPGMNEVGGGLDGLAREEALRAHAVIYLCDGDLTRTQAMELDVLLGLGKPCVLALNKIDRYTTEEHQLVRRRLAERIPPDRDVVIVSIRSGGVQEVVRRYPDGREETDLRQLAPEIDELRVALQRIIDRDPETLEQLRDSSVFVLTARKLDKALAEHRRGEAEQLVSRYSKRAVIGALAAVTPGTDVLVQGYLGLSMTRELCALYDVPAKDVDTKMLLDLVQKHVGKKLTLLLAIAGNGLKAFPGLGTLAGGLIHAVAYGMIFDTLGRAVARTLDTRGELHPAVAAVEFKEGLSENLEASARRFAKIALAEKNVARSDGG
jgi:GTP-binding protein EngB required for normal cell division